MKMMSAVLHRRSGLLSMPNREPGVIVKFRESLAILRNYGSPLEIILPMQTLFPREILRQKVLLRCSSIGTTSPGVALQAAHHVSEASWAGQTRFEYVREDPRLITCFDAWCGGTRSMC